jgi:hypothetical protein
MYSLRRRPSFPDSSVSSSLPKYLSSLSSFRCFEGPIDTSTRFSMLRQASMNHSVVSTPTLSMIEETLVRWLAISSIIFRFVPSKKRLFLKKSQWARTWAITIFCSTREFPSRR